MMINCSQHKQSGFSLVEVLVYLAVLLFIVAGSVGLMLSMGELLAKHKAEHTMLRASSMVLDNIILTTKNATAIREAASTFGTTNSTLVVATSAGDTTYSIADNRLYVAVGAAVPLPLTGSEVSVTSFIVHSADSGASSLIEVELELATTYGERTYTETFYITRVLQASYE